MQWNAKLFVDGFALHASLVARAVKKLFSVIGDFCYRDHLQYFNIIYFLACFLKSRGTEHYIWHFTINVKFKTFLSLFHFVKKLLCEMKTNS